MQQTLLKFLSDEVAATSIEYAMISCGIAATIVAAVLGLGSEVHSNYDSVDTALR